MLCSTSKSQPGDITLAFLPELAVALPLDAVLQEANCASRWLISSPCLLLPPHRTYLDDCLTYYLI
jgi:hypothetical protein